MINFLEAIIGLLGTEKTHSFMLDTTSPILRSFAVALAIGALGYFLLQTQPAPVISAWGGNTGQSAMSGQAQPITGAAQPIGRGAANADVPTGNPLGTVKTVMTQGYGVGTHAPASIWGAVDLAIDADGDGNADQQATMNAPIYATHRGTIKLTPNSVPAGNHIWLLGSHFKTGYSHLSRFAVADGQQVEPGDVIGYIGTTGQSSGPHLDYQVWKDGVNVNPLDYGALGT